jgi:ABC-type antimicrobial peptide transport system permease subunit
LKGKLSTSLGEVFVRKGLVVFQFCVSIILIISVLIVYKQIGFVQSKNLGYNRYNVVTFAREGKLNQNAAAFLTELRNIPGVTNASCMGGDLVGNHGGGGGIDWEGKTHRVEFAALWVDYNLIESLGLTMKDGRSFSSNFRSDSAKVIFNETAIAAMGLKHPIGKTVKLWGREAEIIGIVKDFHFESLYDKVKPFFFGYSAKGENVVIKIQPGKERETLATVERLYHTFNPGIPFEYKFLDDTYNALYASEQRIADLSLYFALIAILISCLGLFGLVSFTAERRVKEFGIRKILGSSEIAIVYLLSIDFTKMIILSILIALPVGYFIATGWLENFSYHISLEAWDFLVAGGATLLMAWLTVGYQAFKAAKLNPTESLRSE